MAINLTQSRKNKQMSQQSNDGRAEGTAAACRDEQGLSDAVLDTGKRSGITNSTVASTASSMIPTNQNQKPQEETKKPRGRPKKVKEEVPDVKKEDPAERTLRKFVEKQKAKAKALVCGVCFGVQIEANVHEDNPYL